MKPVLLKEEINRNLRLPVTNYGYTVPSLRRETGEFAVTRRREGPIPVVDNNVHTRDTNLWKNVKLRSLIDQVNVNVRKCLLKAARIYVANSVMHH
ncbi:13341_t:CDS:2 [Acaulospora morrowiae]|uniref:13341_t:CDS:1 n=1 Tax=Acaulospora morrowiae TaxID=94023 RepID=A0A9N9FB31_9GLOM|nr:13341_t:CDS:2 [Acaulospora morrowiae]